MRKTTTHEKQLFKAVLGKNIEEVYESVGCEECHGGYKGRIAIHEVLLINQEIRDAISTGVKKEDLRVLVYNDDVITLLQDGLYKVIAGFTSFEEVLKLIEVDDEISDIEAMEKAMSNIGK